MEKVFYVGIGGFIGASLRYLTSLVILKCFKYEFPVATLIINVVGAVLIGLIMYLSLKSNAISLNLKLFLTTGILGGLTTFSTFSFETVSLFQNGRYAAFISNIILNVGLSLSGVVIGMMMVKFVRI